MPAKLQNNKAILLHTKLCTAVLSKHYWNLNGKWIFNKRLIEWFLSDFLNIVKGKRLNVWHKKMLEQPFLIPWALELILSGNYVCPQLSWHKPLIKSSHEQMLAWEHHVFKHTGWVHQYINIPILVCVYTIMLF